MTKGPKLANFVKRVCAYFIDLIVVTLGIDAVLAIMQTEEPQPSVVTFIFLLFQGAYHAFSEGSSWQASPGQRLMGLYIMRTNGSKLDKGFALNRYLSQVLLMILLAMAKIIFVDMLDLLAMWAFVFYLLNLLMLFWYASACFDSERRTVHDKLFKTVVLEGK